MARKVQTARKDQYELAKTNQEDTEGSNIQYRQPAASRPACSTSRVWLVFTIVFLLTTLALGGYLIYVKLFEQRRQISFEEEIIMKYPGYFRTPEEQALFEEQYNQVAGTIVHSTPDSTTILNNCSFSCQVYRIKRSAIQAQVDQSLVEMVKLYGTIHAMSKRAAIQNRGNKIYHACCISQHQFVSPDAAEDSDGRNVTILKLNNQAQYFITEKCQQAQSCTGCTCGQGTTLMSAVVTSADSNGQSSVSLKLIKLPGCCKCLNVQV